MSTSVARRKSAPICCGSTMAIFTRWQEALIHLHAAGAGRRDRRAASPIPEGEQAADQAEADAPPLRRADTMIETTEHTVAVPHLPPALQGLRVAHLTDFHRSRHTSDILLRQAVAAANAAHPDLILLTGDYVTNDPHDIAPCAHILAPLQAPPRSLRDPGQPRLPYGRPCGGAPSDGTRLSRPPQPQRAASRTASGSSAWTTTAITIPMSLRPFARSIPTSRRWSWRTIRR